MIPFNAMATESLKIPYLERNHSHRSLQLLPAAKCVQLKASNEISINRAVLHLITVPGLRAAYIFQFKEKATWWTVYQNKHNPLREHEVRGAMVLAIQQAQRNISSTLLPITTCSNAFVQPTENIIRHLQSFSKEEKVFIVLVFKDYAMVTGNFYDETTLCRALLNFRPRKADKVIRILRRDIPYECPFSFIQKQFLEEKRRREEWLLIS